MKKLVIKMQKNKNYFLVISLIVIFLGISLIIYNLYNNNNIKRIEKISIEYFFNTNNNTQEKQYNIIKKDKLIEYIAILEIPKINLKQGLVRPNSNLNNVNKNIQILTPFNRLDQLGTNLILAGHSGNSKVSFFRNINNLEIGNDIYIYYQNKKYHYKVLKKYEVEKTGKIHVKSNQNKTLLTLTTCSYNNKQLIILSEQINSFKY